MVKIAVMVQACRIEVWGLRDKAREVAAGYTRGREWQGIWEAKEILSRV